MSSTFRGAPAAAAVLLLVLAACGGDSADTATVEGAAPSDSAPAVVAGAPAAGLGGAIVAGPGDSAGTALPGATLPGVPSAPAPAASDRTPPPRPAPAEPITPEEAQRYPLTMERIRQLARAGEELGRLQRSNPALRDSMAVAAPEPNAILERLMNVPEARAAVGRAGMSPREYTLTTLALMQAAMVSQMRQQGMTPPIPANEDNVRLVGENFEEIQRLMRQVAQQAPGQQQ